MHQIDIRNITAAYAKVQGHFRPSRGHLVDRVKQFRKMKEWAQGKEHIFVYESSYQQLPSYIEFSDYSDAIAFKLTFLV